MYKYILVNQLKLIISKINMNQSIKMTQSGFIPNQNISTPIKKLLNILQLSQINKDLLAI